MREWSGGDAIVFLIYRASVLRIQQTVEWNSPGIYACEILLSLKHSRFRFLSCDIPQIFDILFIVTFNLIAIC